MKKYNTQKWLPFVLRLILSIFFLIVAIVQLCQVTADNSTLEKVVSNFTKVSHTLFWFSVGLYWAISAALFSDNTAIEELEERVKELEERIEVLENKSNT